MQSFAQMLWRSHQPVFHQLWLLLVMLLPNHSMHPNLRRASYTSMTCAEKAPRMVETPTRAVGLNLSTASRRVFW